MSYYDVLRVSRNATLKEIKTAYKSLVKRYHPDIYEGNKLYAEIKIKEINEAYNILTSKQMKSIYDADLNYEEKYNCEYIKSSRKKINKKNSKDEKIVDKTEFVYKIIPTLETTLKNLESKMLKEQKENLLIFSLLVSIMGILYGIVNILYFPF